MMVSRWNGGEEPISTTNQPFLSDISLLSGKASWIADQLRKAVVDSHTGTRTFEDNRDVTIGINSTDNGNSEANASLELQQCKTILFLSANHSGFRK